MRPNTLSAGELFEARVARLLQAEGAFARRRINLETQYGEKFKTITDIDVLAFEFRPDLSARLTAVECKTTEARSQPATGDRLLWLAGVRRLVRADRAILASGRRVEPHQRTLAGELGCEVLDATDIERREVTQRLAADGQFGAHDPLLLAEEHEVFAAIKDLPELKRLYWFSRAELWLSPPIPALKRAFGALRHLSGRWSTALPNEEKRSVEWLARNISVGAVLALVRVAGVAYGMGEEAFSLYLRERLAEGVASYQAMTEISRQVDKYVVAVMAKAGASPSVSASAMGAFAPEPPSYADPLLEVVIRLAGSPHAASRLPILADFAMASAYGVSGADERGDPEAARLLRLVTAFLEGQVRLPPQLTEFLRTESGNGLRPPPQTGLFDQQLDAPTPEGK